MKLFGGFRGERDTSAAQKHNSGGKAENAKKPAPSKSKKTTRPEETERRRTPEELAEIE